MRTKLSRFAAIRPALQATTVLTLSAVLIATAAPLHSITTAEAPPSAGACPATAPPTAHAAASPGSPAIAARPARTGRFTLVALGDNRASDLDAHPGRYDLLICSDDARPELIDTFRTRNPGAAVFYYFNTSDIDGDMIRYPFYKRLWDDINPHEDWFHHDAKGERTRIYYPRFKNRCALNTGNEGLRNYLASRVVEALRTGRYDGVQLDNVSTEFPFREDLVGSWHSGVPSGMTPDKWMADEVALLRTVKRAVSDAGLRDKAIIFNHMRSGEPAESAAYLEASDGANCEYWMTIRTERDGRWGWKAKVDQVLQANRNGKLTNVLNRSASLSEDEALFVFASYLMAKDGSRAYFSYAPSYKVADQRTWYGFYDVDLGEPRGGCEARDGGFWRLFAKGGVAINPTAASVIISLPGRFRTLDGRTIEKLSLEGKRGAILLAAAPAP